MEPLVAVYTGEDRYAFVSYSHVDQSAVWAEIACLNENGVNVWFDDGINPGSVWRDEVALALASCSVVLFFVSPDSVRSEHCQQELNFALTRGKDVLCVYLDSTTLPPGMELSLSDKQAILRHEMSDRAYRSRLTESLRGFLAGERSYDTPMVSLVGDDVPSHDEQSIAVLPLTNRNLEADLDYLTEGIAEELVRGLTEIKGLRVAPHLAASQLGRTPIVEVGARLNVRHVLHGSIQRAGSRLRVNVLLTDVTEGRARWSQRYDGTLEDVFDFQDDVAARVVGALELELIERAGARTIDVGTANAHAYEAVLLGRQHFVKMTSGALLEARRCFRRAIDLDSDYLVAHDEVIHAVFAQICHYPDSASEAAAEIAALIPSCERLDPGRTLFDWNEIVELADGRVSVPGWDAIEQAQRSIDAIRAGAKKHRRFGGEQPFVQLSWLACAFGLARVTADVVERSLARSPEGTVTRTVAFELAAYAWASLGEFERAFDVLERALDENETRIGARVFRAALFSRTGQYGRAEEDLNVLRGSVPRNHGVFSHLYWSGETAAAVDYFDDLARHANYPLWTKVWGSLMLADPQLGDSAHADERIEQAVDYLEKGTQAHAIWVPQIRTVARAQCTDAVVAALESNDRYQRWLRAVGLDDGARDAFIDIVNTHSASIGIAIGK